MELRIKLFSMVVVVTAVISFAALPQAVAADAALVEKGKKIAFDRKQGNCLTCHQISGGTLMGNIGPPLVAMKARFPDKAKLRQDIWDMTSRNPHTMMPPFGKYRIISESDIDAVVEFMYSL